MDRRFVYDFTEGSGGMRDLLGGKGANLAEMVRVLGEQAVPPGFTVTTQACMEFLRSGSAPAGLDREIDRAIEALERRSGLRFGDASEPMLVSVRSGGRVSMPGMMDTVLNLGLTGESLHGLARGDGDPRFAWDSYRRLVQMFANVVRGVSGDDLERAIESIKRERGATLDSDLDRPALEDLVDRFKEMIVARSGAPFPDDPRRQLGEAIEAVFRSWNGARAVHYRRINSIPDDWGTAVNVQLMVFGNRGRRSGSGVAFSRDELTGSPPPSGDWLPRSQGEDVVSGSRDPLGLDDLRSAMPAIHSELIEILRRLERHFGDMQDVEFTVDDGRLWILQARTAKRPAHASVRFACDSVDEGLLDPDRALMTIDPSSLDSLLLPTLSRAISPAETAARGVAASPGAARGSIRFSAEAAIAAAAAGEPVILVRRRTEADDVAGFHAAAGILTSTGGKASHAALVARGMGKPCVCGAVGIEVDAERRVMHLPDGTALGEGDTITIDGSTGSITLAAIDLVEPALDEHVQRVLAWADAARTLGVRANADTPEDAARAKRLGAEGIGLCRTEHMFMSAGRQELMRDVILASGHGAASLERLRDLQQEDFEGIFTEMEGLPVTIRLLDPPLHEFLRDPSELERMLESAQARGDADAAEALSRELEAGLGLHEANPMLGTRGVRLGLLRPEINSAQVEAACRAALSHERRTGSLPRFQLMIPLVAFAAELALSREAALRIAGDEGLAGGRAPAIGTMIELPRACIVADRIAAHADFFSFGTNDLTQTALGFSRDDIESTVLDSYLELGVVRRSPFESLDVDGVGELVRIASERGRGARSDLELALCGEHGGDPDSIRFLDSIGLDYVSCSPFRIPTARVAAAQAFIRNAGRPDAGPAA